MASPLSEASFRTLVLLQIELHPDSCAISLTNCPTSEMVIETFNYEDISLRVESLWI